MPAKTPDPEPPRRDTRDEPDAATAPVGTFAAGQSPRGEFEVSTEAPVGSFASGLTEEDDPNAAGLTEEDDPNASRRTDREDPDTH
jgi:hypothetical protein